MELVGNSDFGLGTDFRTSKTNIRLWNSMVERFVVPTIYILHKFERSHISSFLLFQSRKHMKGRHLEMLVKCFKSNILAQYTIDLDSYEGFKLLVLIKRCTACYTLMTFTVT